MVVEGNHKLEAQAENVTFAAYSSRFAFPSEESGSSTTFYYSFNAGGIHFLMLGGYLAYNKSADQYKWLERDLATVNRKVTPWLVAIWHPPWYSSYTAHYREVECMKVAIEELLYNHGVDIVFNRHVTPVSATDCAGILPGDVIVKCGGNSVRGFLEFFAMICDKIGANKERKTPVDIVVIREASDCLNLTVVVDETTLYKFNSWPLPEKQKVFLKKVRRMMRLTLNKDPRQRHPFRSC